MELEDRIEKSAEASDIATPLPSSGNGASSTHTPRRSPFWRAISHSLQKHPYLTMSVGYGVPILLILAYVSVPLTDPDHTLNWPTYIAFYYPFYLISNILITAMAFHAFAPYVFPVCIMDVIIFAFPMIVIPVAANLVAWKICLVQKAEWCVIESKIWVAAMTCVSLVSGCTVALWINWRERKKWEDQKYKKREAGREDGKSEKFASLTRELGRTDKLGSLNRDHGKRLSAAPTTFDHGTLNHVPRTAMYVKSEIQPLRTVQVLWYCVGVGLAGGTYFAGQIFSYFYFLNPPPNVILQVVSIQVLKIVVNSISFVGCMIIEAAIGTHPSIIYPLAFFCDLAFSIFYRNFYTANLGSYWSFFGLWAVSFGQQIFLILFKISPWYHTILLRLASISTSAKPISTPWMNLTHFEPKLPSISSIASLNDTATPPRKSSQPKEHWSYEEYTMAQSLFQSFTTVAQLVSMVTFLSLFLLIRYSPNALLYPTLAPATDQFHQILYATLLTLGAELLGTCMGFYIVYRRTGRSVLREHLRFLVAYPRLFGMICVTVLHILCDIVQALVTLRF